MYRSQYLASSNPVTCPPEFQTTQFAGLNVYTHPSLSVVSAECGDVRLLLLGTVVDPLKPENDNQAIVRDLADECDTSGALYREAQKLSGRFVLLLNSNDEFVAVHDACALRQVYYSFVDGKIVLTSSLRMFLELHDEQISIEEGAKEFTESPEYVSREHAWYGDRCLDARFRQLLPNFSLDLLRRKAIRLPVAREILNEVDTVAYAARVLEGTIEALVRRGPVIQALTAGWDSRILLAAAKRFRHDISFFVFDMEDGSQADVEVPRKLAANLGFDLKVIRPLQLQEEFLDVYRAEHVDPRVLPKTRHVQHHFLEKSHRDATNVNGNCAEIARCFYGRPGIGSRPIVFQHFSGYSSENKYALKSINEWLAGAQSYAAENQIEVLDLFYWEQRMGRWGALAPAELDIAIDEISPFNNRNLLLSIMQQPARQRVAPSYTFFRNLVNEMWPEVLTEPINPCGPLGRLKNLMRHSSLSKYYCSRLQKMVSGRKSAYAMEDSRTER